MTLLNWMMLNWMWILPLLCWILIFEGVFCSCDLRTDEGCRGTCGATRRRVKLMGKLRGR